MGHFSIEEVWLCFKVKKRKQKGHKINFWEKNKMYLVRWSAYLSVSSCPVLSSSADNARNFLAGS